MPTSPAPPTQSTVLLVDDEPSVLETTATLISAEFRVMAELSSSAALARLGQTRVDVLCTDYQLPGVDGLELIRRATELHPHLVSVLVTAYGDLLMSDVRKKSEHALVLIKPYAPPKLLETLRQAEHFARVNQLMAGSRAAKTRPLRR